MQYAVTGSKGLHWSCGIYCSASEILKWLQWSFPPTDGHPAYTTKQISPSLPASNTHLPGESLCFLYFPCKELRQCWVGPASPQCPGVVPLHLKHKRRECEMWRMKPAGGKRLEEIRGPTAQFVSRKVCTLEMVLACLSTSPQGRAGQGQLSCRHKGWN